MSEALELEFIPRWKLRVVSADEQASEYVLDTVQELSDRIADLKEDPDVVDIQYERYLHTVTITRPAPMRREGSVLALLRNLQTTEPARLAVVR